MDTNLSKTIPHRNCRKKRKPGKPGSEIFAHIRGFSSFVFFIDRIASALKLKAEPVDDPAGLLTLGALNMAPCPNGFQPAHLWNCGVICCGRIQRSLEIGQFDVVQAGVMSEHDHLKFVFVYRVVVDLPALREVKDHHQLLLIPVGMPAQQFHQRRFVLPPCGQIGCHILRTEGEAVLVHYIIKKQLSKSPF